MGIEARILLPNTELQFPKTRIKSLKPLDPKLTRDGSSFSIFNCHCCLILIFIAFHYTERQLFQKRDSSYALVSPVSQHNRSHTILTHPTRHPSYVFIKYLPVCLHLLSEVSNSLGELNTGSDTFPLRNKQFAYKKCNTKFTRYYI